MSRSDRPETPHDAARGRRRRTEHSSERSPTTDGAIRRLAVSVTGTVQGVGFRPFVSSTARKHRLSGWVRNAAGGALLEVEGAAPSIEAFVAELRAQRGPATLESVAMRELRPTGARGFEILDSEPSIGGEPGPVLPPDRALCEACAAETEDPGDRRHGYPFTNCAHCGPRYSITEALPYDRPRTVMKRFALCEACAAEYRDVDDRRFHAQPIACPSCGPTLELTTSSGEPVARGPQALALGASLLTQGAVLALKGLGGYQLLVDATSDLAVRVLRARKHRDDKPLAVMFPSLEAAAEE